MSLVYMQGFDTMRNDSDARAQGLLAPAGSSTTLTLSVPSFTGVNGFALRPIVYASDDNTTLPGASGATDIGYINTGVTVNQAWQAGGITVGASATLYQSGRFLPGNGAASSGASCNRVLAFDGTLYWALQATSVWTSPDLVNWTQTPSTPTAILGTTSSIYYMGSGVVMVTAGGSFQTNLTVAFTSNRGASWTTQTLFTQSTTYATYGAGIATGNPSFPHVIVVGYGTSTSNHGVYVGTLGGTFTKVSSASIAFSGSPFCKLVNGYLICGAGGVLFSAKANDPNLNTAGAWTVTTGFSATMVDMDFYPKANAWIAVDSRATPFVASLVNPGTSAAPLPPTSPTCTPISNNSFGCNVTIIGETCIATGGTTTGSSSLYLYSTDGATWNTKFTVAPITGATYPIAFSGQYFGWVSAIYDGSKFIKIGTGSRATFPCIIATSPDGINNWQIVYCADQATGSQGGYAGFGFVTSTTAPQSGTAWQIGTSRALINADSSLNLAVWGASTTTALTTVTGLTTPATHYYEITLTPVAGNPNQFTFTVSVDQQVKYTSPAYIFGSSASDTTSVLVVTFPRSSRLSNWDDLYITLNDGNGLVGPLGTVNIQTLRPSSDAQAQWTPGGVTQSSNAQTVRSSALSQALGYVTTSTDGASDQYSTADTVLSNYSVLAAKVETFVEKTSVSPPVVTVGLKSGEVEVDSPQITVNNSTYAMISQIVEKDPNTNANWTPTSIGAAKATVTKIS